MIDRLLFAAITRKWSRQKVDGYAESMKAVGEEIPPHIAEAFQSIDVKSAGLLTHVSMMIAGLGICAPLLAQNPVEEAMIIFEIAIYLIIAIGCLRCLSVVASSDFGDDPHASLLNRELILRQGLYSACNRASIIFTTMVFVSLPVMLYWTPEK